MEAMATELSADQFLSLSTDERVRWVRQNVSKTGDGSRNTQNLTGWDVIPMAERAVLGQALLEAVELATAPSVDATALAGLLHQIPSEPQDRTLQKHQPRPSYSPTEVYDSEGEEERDEVKRHQALHDDGARPLFDAALVPQIQADPDAYAQLLRPYSRPQGPADTRDAWHALSRQWNRWKNFRFWQNHGRGKKPGFDEPEAQPSHLSRSARQCWEREYDYEDEEDVEGHAQRCSELLAHQGFVSRRPSSLLADPKTQDQWTTYVEYLAFEIQYLHQLDEVAQRMEKGMKPRNGYEETYQADKADVEMQQSKIEWILSEIEKIEAEQKAAAGESGGNPSGSSGDRNHTDDANPPEDAFVPPQEKTGEEIDKAVGAEMVPAGKSANSSQTRRSKKRKSAIEVDEEEEEEKEEEGDVREPQAKRRRVAGKRDAPSSNSQPQALGPRAPAVSKGTTATQVPPPGRRSKRSKSDARSERLRSLRPRANGKAVTSRSQRV
ncbi:hypothetical protein MAPG_10863 [Magnaporthiopsis poae ATCC 64411]|uniref:Uncharacterized protein n=1 Tax=Magnaporthiopsis poae (strain ATCC 64411 / 73-15) TaxID=644358 RepID=A0A0C4EDQ5_MAGP6|nr:hypothetical protein MAPG_10863 [Magnaporthiopsis poae ATCC 64411]